MEKYRYTAKDKKGNLATGVLEGDSRDEIASSLINQVFTPVKINDTKSDFIKKLSTIGTIPSSEKVLFAEELATLINAGVPIAQSLSILEKQIKNQFKKVY
jgi:type IV pilus assembly protein PilC